MLTEDEIIRKIEFHREAIRGFGVKKIVLGECGHAHKALSVIADRVLTGDLNIPCERLNVVYKVHHLVTAIFIYAAVCLK